MGCIPVGRNAIGVSRDGKTKRGSKERVKVQSR